MDEESFSVTQDDAAIEHTHRVRSLRQAQNIVRDVGGVVGAALNDTLSRVISSEQKRFGAMMRSDAAVCQEVFAGLEAEEALMRRARVEFQEHMTIKREKERVKRQLKEAKNALVQVRKEQRNAEAVVAAAEAVKVYSLEELGHGNKKGGTKQHQKARMDVLDRLRRAAELSAQQTGAWDFFKTSWDREMSNIHLGDWAELFAEMVQNVLNDLYDGRSNALSVFMDNETRRILPEIPALAVPGLS